MPGTRGRSARRWPIRGTTTTRPSASMRWSRRWRRPKPRTSEPMCRAAGGNRGDTRCACRPRAGEVRGSDDRVDPVLTSGAIFFLAECVAEPGRHEPGRIGIPFGGLAERFLGDEPRDEIVTRVRTSTGDGGSVRRSHRPKIRSVPCPKPVPAGRRRVRAAGPRSSPAGSPARAAFAGTGRSACR